MNFWRSGWNSGILRGFIYAVFKENFFTCSRCFGYSMQDRNFRNTQLRKKITPRKVQSWKIIRWQKIHNNITPFPSPSPSSPTLSVVFTVKFQSNIDDRESRVILGKRSLNLKKVGFLPTFISRVVPGESKQTPVV